MTSAEDRPRLTRAAIRETFERLHPPAFVYMHDDHPVLVDDGHAWLLFLDDWGNGCRFGCDGEDMGVVASQAQLEQVVSTVAAAYRELSPEDQARAVQHTSELTELSWHAVYERAKECALVP